MQEGRYSPDVLMKRRFHRAPGDRRAASPNERSILAEIWRQPEIARAMLSGKFNITQQSIHRITSALEARGLISLGPLEPPKFRGKPSPKLSLNPRFACALGISINTDSASIALMDFAGKVRTRIIALEGLAMDATMRRIDTIANELLSEMGFERPDLFGVGFAISGFVIEGTRYSAPEPLHEWSQPQLRPYLAEHFRLPVWTENGANTGALYERMFGLGQRYNNFAYLSFNYGFGGGIILDGELMRGGFGNAGELSGMFTMDEMDDRPRLRSLIQELQRHGVSVSSIHELAQRFDPDWPGVQAWLDRVSPATSRVINVLSAVVDPEIVVFGGQIPTALAKMLIARTQFFHTEARYGVIRKQPQLRPASMGGETAAIGAALLPFKSSLL